MKIGVVGGGFVGHAVARGFMEHGDVLVYDLLPDRRTHELAEVLLADFVFICLPTPAHPDGSCDTSAIDGIIEHVCTVGGLGPETVLVLKSTVAIGTTERYARQLANSPSPASIVHHPEFLTARCAVADFHTPARNLVGMVRDLPESIVAGARLVKLLTKRFPGVPCLAMQSCETEQAKLTCNSWFATKVTFFNDVYATCEQIGTSYETVLSAVMSDGRIAHSHTQVPGPSGGFGYGGTCLPKDIANLRVTMQQVGLGAELLSAVEQRNRQLRAVPTNGQASASLPEPASSP